MEITFCVDFPAETFTVEVLSLFPVEILVFKVTDHFGWPLMWIFVFILKHE